MRWMLDTATAAVVLRRSDASVLKRLGECAVGEVCLSAVTASELQFGVLRSHRPRQERAAVDLLLRHVDVLAYPAEAAEGYGEIREAMEIFGERCGGNAMLVAAHARFAGLTLVVQEWREWRRVPGLAVECWGQ